MVALIPAFDEADRVGETVAAALTLPGVEEVVVVDDGSSDDTSAVAAGAGARVIRLERNAGKGAALSEGIKQADADIYLLLDADLGHSARQTAPLLEPVAAGLADMTIAAMRPPPGHKGGFGLVMRLSRWAVRRLGGAEISAPLSGQRALRREVIEQVGGFEERFGLETALTIDALRRGFRVVEVPLDLTHRATGRDLKGFLHRGRQFRDVAMAVWRRRR